MPQGCLCTLAEGSWWAEMERLWLVLGILVVASLAWWWWNSRQGAVREAHIPGALTPADLDAPRGERGTVVVFSTPMCAKCPGTKALFASLISDMEGVDQVEVDASVKLDLASRLGIMRTPTVLLLDSRGVAVTRIDGAPSIAQAQEALDALPPISGYSI